MGEAGRSVREAGLTRERVDGDGRVLLDLAAEVWPNATRGREIAGLPPIVAELLCPQRVKRGGRQAARELDRRRPGWVEAAARVIAEATHFPPALQRLCALLGHRPIQDPGPLLRRLEMAPDDPEPRLWLLVALSGTDTAAVRRAWSYALRRACNVRSLTGRRVTWFALVRALLGSWLTWTEFRDALAVGQALTAVSGGGSYRPGLERLGVWSNRTFSTWYRQVVYEMAAQPDVSLSWGVGGWIRAFPGPDYLFDALARLQEEPSSWWPLSVLRWTTDLPVGDPDFVQELRRCSPTALCLLSLLRPDLAEDVEAAWSCPNHAEIIRWLLNSDPTSPVPERWCEEVLAPWVEEYYEVITVAVGALCSLVPPPNPVFEAGEERSRGAFLHAHFGLDMGTLMDNYLGVLALREDHFALVEEEARRGRPGALRALTLRPEWAERTVPLLFSLRQRGTREARKVAEAMLTHLAEQAGLPDLAALEQRMDFAAAWADGSAGAPGRVWWSIGSYQLRLAVQEGKVRLIAYSGDKALRAVPPEVRRDPAFPVVRQAREELSRRYHYLRGRLEQGMEEQRVFTGADFSVLLCSPAARSLVAGLVLHVDGEEFLWRPTDPVLETEIPARLAQAKDVRVAHPVLLHRAGTLETWQERMVDTHLGQPFKQLFREVYVEGGEERAEGACLRFAGRPVKARQAFALLRGRGYKPGAGEATKQYPGSRLCAHLEWAGADEPVGKLLGQSEPEAPVTFGAIWFATEAGEPLVLGEVPPALFSETLRDADLTVSRAAFGEAGFSSAETRRLRAILIRHLTRAMGLTTVYVSEDHAYALIDGAHALYRLHLGSGSVLLDRTRRHVDVSGLMRETAYQSLLEGMDTSTSHIVRTVLLLCRDQEITDPGFLKQLGLDETATKEM